MKLTAPLLASALVFAGTVALPSQVQADPASNSWNSTRTTFQCVTSGRNFVTIARRGNVTTDPMILWKSTEFGREYTPWQRCQIVSNRLTKAVAQNGGRLSNLQLTTGIVNNLPVVCYVNGRGRCNSQNLLFTLDKRNAKNPGEALTKLINFAQDGSGPVAVFRTGAPSSAPQFVPFGDMVDRAFNSPNKKPSVPVAKPQGDRGI
ncbi:MULTISPECIES: COP23 domain-containing protein [unclassified Microcoleus]|uniref:COP23 domain-containing protein n=1 Tax=unclassified Microcoleus TaxID=2642155 RepID=UPI002FD67670